MALTLFSKEQLPPRTRKELESLVIALRALYATDLAGFTEGETETFLREDGTFAPAGLTQAQVLTRISFRG